MKKIIVVGANHSALSATNTKLWTGFREQV